MTDAALTVIGSVPEGMEFLAALLTVFGSLAIMVAFGYWWSR